MNWLVIFYSVILLLLSFDVKFINKISTSRVNKLIYAFPIIAGLISWSCDVLTRESRVSSIYNADNEIVNNQFQINFDFLPDISSSDESIHLEKTPVATSLKSYALVTGASRGIGRSIAISLARRRFNLILVAKDHKRLEAFATELHESYGVSVVTISKDLSADNAAQEIFQITQDKGLEVDILMSNAGMCRVGDVLDMSVDMITYLTRLNFESVVQLSNLFGNEMKLRRKGRIVIISSLTGSVMGVPTAAVYAANKAGLNSFSASFGKEMEAHAVPVTLIIPGAVTNTNFSKMAQMEKAFIWDFPIGILTPEIVAESTVQAMIAGKREVVIGWLNVIMARIVNHLLPKSWILTLCELSFNPFVINWKNKRKTPHEDAKEL
jgi:uncharacterized protein